MIFTVEDNGIGISDEDLARLGEPYFQACSSYDRRHAGTGLGLSIVKGLVRLHGGALSIRSRIGEGTCVTVCLPLDCERVRPRSPSQQDLAPAGSVRRFATSLASNASGRAASPSFVAVEQMPVRKSA
jgi:cell cycle sensor histidine kinase DivJ